MPLILISGFPSSGKTHRSQQLITFFNSKIATSDSPRIKRIKIQHISDDTLGLSREVYATARAEKDARATFSSAIKRALDRDTIVVADGLNYIKGFRYQLYCEAKAVQTPSCVLQVGVPAEKCREINEQALDRRKQTQDSTGGSSANGGGSGSEGAGAGYDPEIFENLIFRYEEPNGMTRWDSPLFIVPYDDASPPCEAIWEAMVGSEGQAHKIVRPNAATVLKPAAEQNYLYELDRVTSEVIAALTTWLKDHPGEGGGEVSISAPTSTNGNGEGGVISLPANAPSLPQLQRLRRQFISLNRQHNLEKSRLRELFVDYLNNSFEQ